MSLPTPLAATADVITKEEAEEEVEKGQEKEEKDLEKEKNNYTASEIPSLLSSSFSSWSTPPLLLR